MRERARVIAASLVIAATVMSMLVISAGQARHTVRLKLSVRAWPSLYGPVLVTRQGSAPRPIPALPALPRIDLRTCAAAETAPASAALPAPSSTAASGSSASTTTSLPTTPTTVAGGDDPNVAPANLPGQKAIVSVAGSVTVRGTSLITGVVGALQQVAGGLGSAAERVASTLTGTLPGGRAGGNQPPSLPGVPDGAAAGNTPAGVVSMPGQRFDSAALPDWSRLFAEGLDLTGSTCIPFGTGDYLDAVSAGSSPAQADALAVAEQQIGTPYVWGGESERHAFDCSGLVQWSFRQAGVILPRGAQAQSESGPDVPWGAKVVPGDLVFFGVGPSSVEHVGIVAGEGWMVDAPHTGAVVRFDRIEGFGNVVEVTNPGT